MSCTCRVSIPCLAHAQSALNVLYMQSQHSLSGACTVSIECPAHAEPALNVLHMQSQHSLSSACRASIPCLAHAEPALNVLHMQSQHWMLGINLSVASCDVCTLCCASDALSDLSPFTGRTPMKKDFTDNSTREVRQYIRLVMGQYVDTR